MQTHLAEKVEELLKVLRQGKIANVEVTMSARQARQPSFVGEATSLTSIANGESTPESHRMRPSFNTMPSPQLPDPHSISSPASSPARSLARKPSFLPHFSSPATTSNLLTA